MTLARRAVLLLPAAAAGCSLLPGQGEPPRVFTLTPKSTFAGDLPRVAAQLVIEAPEAAQGLDTPRIALQRSPVTIEYYARAAWSDRAPQMVQSLLVETFENTRRIVGVSRDSTRLRPNFLLLTELREFQAVYARADQPPDALVRMTARLVRLPERAIVAFDSAEGRVRAQNTELEAVVYAFDEALGRVLRRIAEWTLRTIAAQPPRTDDLTPIPVRR